MPGLSASTTELSCLSVDSVDKQRGKGNIAGLLQNTYEYLYRLIAVCTEKGA